LTEAGEDLLHKSAGLVAELDDVLLGVGRDEGQIKGVIRLLVPTSLNHLFLNQVLAQFMVQHPNVNLDIALIEKSVNPLEEGCDMVISGHSSSYPRVVDVALAAVNPILCASPKFLDASKRPEHPSELSTRPCLVYRPTDAHWRFESTKGPVTIDVLAHLMADDNHTLLQAAVAGSGIVILPRYVCQNALDAGQLEIVMPSFQPMQNWFKAHIPQRKFKLARVQALLQWLQFSFKKFDQGGVQ
jgi:DNA-binding transcriptional LysR family regulator